MRVAIHLAVLAAFGIPLVPAQAATDTDLVKAAIVALARDMKDPGSMQLRDVFIREADGIRYVCGEVNGKNSFGGYAGFKQFYSTGAETRTRADERAGSREFDDHYSTYCGTKARSAR